MTDTATIPRTAGASALSGRPYPAAAVIDAERYWWHLARLRESRTRAQAAGHAWSLATAATHIAAALADNPPTAPDPGRDPAAWHGLAGYLGWLAMALDGAFCPGPEGDEPGDRAAREVWEHLAGTVTRSEFTAAWRPLGECLRQRAGLGGSQSDRDERDAFAAGQTAMVASAIIGAPW